MTRPGIDVQGNVFPDIETLLSTERYNMNSEISAEIHWTALIIVWSIPPR